jgi:hypothetical protein
MLSLSKHERNGLVRQCTGANAARSVPSPTTLRWSTLPHAPAAEGGLEKKPPCHPQRIKYSTLASYLTLPHVHGY